MKLSYSLTRETMAEAMSASIVHRRPILRFLNPIFGVIFLTVSIYFFIANDSMDWHFGLAFFILSVFYFISPKVRQRKAINNIFIGKTEPINVSLTVSPDKLDIQTNDSSGIATWQSFIDFKICHNGILLYPQKSIYYWIPKSAQFDEGTWEDFTNLISSNISKKI
jgi:hypothetical protein